MKEKKKTTQFGPILSNDDTLSGMKSPVDTGRGGGSSFNKGFKIE